ncbi:MAG: UDP-N-acetylglucosamine 2-epimerase (non-hydrolyzing) [Candidatus Pacearchaeota archaeon]|nr:UDP-N-acetylglucosamine 2-epimerase (non-hydrolyzing) [Candidatus Pacearchaeota archaeon]
MTEGSKIAIVIGTKAELIKCMPIMLELQKQKKDYWFVHTGQHSLGKACEDFGIKKPDFILSKEPNRSTKFWSKINRISFLWFLMMNLKIRRLLKKIKPGYVIYHGDTMSTAAAAIASSSFLSPGKNWKSVHLEAGLRSGSSFEPFPEEISRKISDRFSDILLAVSDLSENNLRKGNYKGRIIKIGNTVVDSSLIAYKKARKKKRKKMKKYALINIHRHENLNSKKRMGKIVEILKSIKIQAIWPIHANTANFIEKYGLTGEVKNMTNIKRMSLTDYGDFIYLLANCKYLVTDGGSIQEESLVFKKPCIILRKKTERQEGLSTGINFLTGLNIRKTKEIINQIENNKIKVKNFQNPYGKPGLSKKITELLK